MKITPLGAQKEEGDAGSLHQQLLNWDKTQSNNTAQLCQLMEVLITRVKGVLTRKERLVFQKETLAVY